MGPEVGVLDMKVYFSALYFVVPGYLILYYWFKLYSPKKGAAERDRDFECV